MDSASSIPSFAHPASNGPPLGPTVAELAMSGPALPALFDAVLVAEACRRAALAMHRVPSSTLAGKDADGRPLRGQHQHAHYVPENRGDDPLRLTHILIYAPQGFLPAESASLARIQYLPRVVRSESELGAVGVTLTGLGRTEALVDSPLCRRGRIFFSTTPFKLPRYRKPGDEPEDQLRRELLTRGLPSPSRVEQIPGPPLPAVLGAPARWSAFLRHRRNDQISTGYCGFRIEFADPVPGPLLLGYGCHYGLGQFVCDV